MKIVTGKTGTPHVTSRQFRGMMEGIIGQDSYIITHGENLEPELVTNNKLKIKSGMMCHHGNISTVEIGTYDEVTIQNGTQGMKRIDLIVNRYSKVEGTGIEENNWVVIQGTPAAEDPVATTYTEGNLQEGDLVDDCPVFEAHLDGINVTEIVKLLDVSKNMSTLNADLSELNSKLDINLTTTEAETHELYEDRRIFTKYVDCKALPNAGNKTYSLDIPSGFAWIDLSNSYVYSDVPRLRTIFPLNYHNEKTGSSITFSLSENDKTITFGTTDDWSAYNAAIVIKYYKY